jgi:eukaryotic-like serine/threonine-protein kinase
MKSIVGKTLRGRYSIARELNEKDFYTKYLAEEKDDRQHHLYEIERFQPEYDERILSLKSWQYLQKRFITEGAILEKLGKHPQIPELLAYFIDNREFYLIREFIEGETLTTKVQRQVFDETEATIWLQDILNILNFVHQMGIAHYNLAPDSLMQRQQDGRIFLTNFTAIERFIATFLSKLKNNKKVIRDSDLLALQINEESPDFSGDIYNLGQTIIYALTGGEFHSIADSNLQIPEVISPKLVRILKKMTAERPRERYRSVIEVLKDLEKEKNVVILPSPFTLDLPPVRTKNQNTTQSARSSLKINKRTVNKILLWFLLLLPFLASLITLSIGFRKSNYNPFIAYINNNYRFKIQYPQNWSVRNVEDPITGEVVVFNSPWESEGDLFQEKVYVTVEPLSSNIRTLEEYTKDVTDKIADRDNRTLEQKQTKIDGRDANILLYSRQDGGLLIRQMEAFVVDNNRVYIIIFVGENVKYPEFYGTVKKMIDSFELQ